MIIDLEFANKLLELSTENDISFDVYEGVLLDSFIIYNNGKLKVCGLSKKYIIVEVQSLNEWSSRLHMTRTDSDKLAQKFIDENEKFLAEIC